MCEIGLVAVEGLAGVTIVLIASEQTVIYHISAVKVNKKGRVGCFWSSEVRTELT